MSEIKQALWELEYRLEHHPDIYKKINYVQLIELSQTIKLGAAKKMDDPELTPFDIKHTIDAFKACIALAATVKESEIATVMLEQSKNIKILLKDYFIPEIDAQIISRDELKKLVEISESTDLTAMLADINQNSLDEKKLESYLNINYDAPDTAPDHDKLTPDERDRRQMAFLIMDKALSGGMLTSGNIGLGALSGIISTIPTLTNPTFPLFPGLIISTYAGVNGILSALDDLNKLP